MIEEARSLLARADAQGELFQPEDLQRLVFESEHRGASPEYTGAGLFEQRPATYKAIVHLSGEGFGVNRIAGIVGVSGHTVAAVQQREGGAIAIVKERLATLSRTGAQICAESILEKLLDPDERKKISARDLAIIHGVLVDKSELLSGAPTAIVKHTSDAAPLSYDDYLNGLQQAEGTSNPGGNPPQKDPGRLLGPGRDDEHGSNGDHGNDGAISD